VEQLVSAGSVAPPGLVVVLQSVTPGSQSLTRGYYPPPLRGLGQGDIQRERQGIAAPKLSGAEKISAQQTLLVPTSVT
jgi:hypothetical protein